MAKHPKPNKAETKTEATPPEVTTKTEVVAREESKLVVMPVLKPLPEARTFGEFFKTIPDEAKVKFKQLEGELAGIEKRVVPAIRALAIKQQGWWNNAFDYLFNQREIIMDKWAQGQMRPETAKKALQANTSALEKYELTIARDTLNNTLKASLDFGKKVLNGIVGVLFGSK